MYASAGIDILDISVFGLGLVRAHRDVHGLVMVDPLHEVRHSLVRIHSYVVGAVDLHLPDGRLENIAL